MFAPLHSDSLLFIKFMIKARGGKNFITLNKILKNLFIFPGFLYSLSLCTLHSLPWSPKEADIGSH